MQNLISLLNSRKAKIGIIGLGYVGLPLSLRYSEEGYEVLGFDIDFEKVHKINSGFSYIEHIPAPKISTAINSGLQATCNFAKIQEVDAIIICVPTPLNKFREPDLSFVIDTMESIKPHLREGQIISLESTTYPGTTDEELKPRIEDRGFKIGNDIYLVYSPEREDPGRTDFNTKTTPKVIGGTTKECLEVGIALYGSVVDNVVPVSTTRAAEMTKLLENIHRAVNIGLVNELKIVCDKMNIDINEVIDAASTKPFGFVAYRPGPGLGGHCIPIDPFYLTWKAREYGLHTRFIELAGEVNSSMPSYVIKKIAKALNSRCKSIRGSKFLILGISYKKNVDDMRESPSVFIMEKLREEGGLIDYSDPHVAVFPKMRDHNFELSSVNLSIESIKGYDCVVLATDHDKFDYDMIINNSHLLVDCRGRYRSNWSHLIRA
jgi:UDP-N-acetyl-D-glucosamine dehydrogenase